MEQQLAKYLAYKKAYKKASKKTSKKSRKIQKKQHGGLIDSSTSMKNIIRRLENPEKYCLQTFSGEGKGEEVKECIKKGKKLYQELALPYERFYLSVEKGDPIDSLFYSGRGKMAKLRRRKESVATTGSNLFRGKETEKSINKSKVIARLANPIKYCTNDDFNQCIENAEKAQTSIAEGMDVSEAVNQAFPTETKEPSTENNLAHRNIFLYGTGSRGIGDKLFSYLFSTCTSLQKNIEAFEEIAEKITKKITNSFPVPIQIKEPANVETAKTNIQTIAKFIHKDPVLHQLLQMGQNKIEYVMISIKKTFPSPKITNEKQKTDETKLIEMFNEIELKLLQRLILAFRGKAGEETKFMEILDKMIYQLGRELKQFIINIYRKAKSFKQQFFKSIVNQLNALFKRNSSSGAGISELQLGKVQLGGGMGDMVRNILSFFFLMLGVFCAISYNMCSASITCPQLMQIKFIIFGIICFFIFCVVNPQSSVNFGDLMNAFV